MRFRSELPLHESKTKITYNDSIFLIGSCFTSSIGLKMQEHKFHTLVNPFGTLFHPTPILHNIKGLKDNSTVDHAHTTKVEDRHVHFDMHSHVHSTSQKELITHISSIRQTTTSFLKRATHAFITLGTSYYFYHKTLNHIVGNCHKQNAALFDRRLSSSEEIKESIHKIISILRMISPDIQVILTISPVRHLRDGMIENNRSKAHLISAAHDLVQTENGVHYFPSYELLMDDLRDYRFYKEDLIHPSEQAIAYIWSYFEQCYFNDETMSINKKLKKITRFLNHRSFDPAQQLHQTKLKEIMTEIDVIEKTHNISLQMEREKCLSQII